MPGNKSNGYSAIPTSRVERLLRERELRKSSRASQSNEATDISRGTELSEHELRLREGDNFGAYYVEQYLEGALAARALGEGWERPDGRPFRQRLLVVANRLPVSAVRRSEESWSLEMSAGGLVTALLGVKEFEARWIGWAGVNVPDEAGQRTLTKALAEKKCIPVFLDEDIVHQYYNGYCNNILWPLFHYIGLPQEDRLATTRSFQSQFAAYKKANQMFADVVNQHYEEGDVVWCHDYHLMFLPKCLKDYNSQMKVGWFLHTPFPSSEIHRTLPSRSELLHAVLAADLVGFHTYDYARHFVSACTRILGLEGTPEGVEDQGRLTRVAAFPIGIDSDRFIRALEVPQVQEHIKELKERFAGRKVMLGVDRLDMIKGIPQKILAFEKFLEENPTWRDKVVLVQIAVPTRTDVPEYQKLTSQVHEIVGRINGRFGTLSAVPIHHLDRSLDFYGLCALYAVTDIALVTSLRDGMNLVSYEFVACQDSKKGVLILSEFAGAAQSLGAGAILVNPWNITEVAASIGQALNMSAEEREKRHRHNFVHVTNHTAQEWAETFVSELNDTVVEAQLRIRQAPPPLPVNHAIEHYMQSSNRLLILGFNATLTEAVDTPGRRGGHQIKEMEPKLHPDLKEPLTALCSDPKTTVVVLSGSGRKVLDDNFRDYNMWLAAENGMFLRFTKGEWMTTMPEHLTMEWVDSVKHVFEYFTDRTPRSHFEPRETSLVWNYKYADVEFGRLQARDMLQHLWTGPISNASVDVVQGSRSVEVRAVGVTKGAAIDRILGEIVHSQSISTPIDYVLCLGHFLGKDEDVYTFFEPELPSDTVGMPRTKVTDAFKIPGERRPPLKLQAATNKSGSKSSSHSHSNKARVPQVQPNGAEKKANNNHICGSGNWRRPSLPEKTSWNVLDLKGENYFSCSVGRTRTNARYVLGSCDEVVAFLKELAEASPSSVSN
ncbi:alpha,alpha-trehalose-phosphate synthase [UDP-forming] 1 [Rhododendron vialii]|uniref:alpha,alpha-trehalose-phosphate synthase [UDP-forming] 1 n=1 Tax=Rhododendron vialii TaxID=182163 RepID=UPI00265E2B9C|nr:alpha,alpha-trehalose-phosphate synthase [UDP-forming] 1 [Rhododendron vialii]XP_058221398.1 alpha,alpha-trehalose-phosphate synthase [UDP-forming] 1 [Rhododendron vialii]XP_058221399.1 alpha,alpha-trehalose-phosphate synthase [UDP-forming] 1 [Rhododendron vialii]XP_058221400.1 alpha,alpha-trehalose-phosphate synthase [UDP-forming] 1 [Rhododendron vialii]XP_058221401.1 alpha,alpha-trehalose-phosphate synthase [UDP-forming] 1 [Rhododendron vialii]XP_058221402.1 alpha,alpha-trehalose-phosphat